MVILLKRMRYVNCVLHNGFNECKKYNDVVETSENSGFAQTAFKRLSVFQNGQVPNVRRTFYVFTENQTNRIFCKIVSKTQTVLFQYVLLLPTFLLKQRVIYSMNTSYNIIIYTVYTSDDQTTFYETRRRHSFGYNFVYSAVSAVSPSYYRS